VANTPGEIELTFMAGVLGVLVSTTPEITTVELMGKSTLVENLTVSMLPSAQA
jgi:hypothetical protein